MGVVVNYPGNIFVYKKLFPIVKDGALNSFYWFLRCSHICCDIKNIMKIRGVASRKGKEVAGGKMTNG